MSIFDVFKKEKEEEKPEKKEQKLAFIVELEKPNDPFPTYDPSNQ